MQKRNSPLQQKRRRPIRKSIKPNRLQSLKNHQHHCPRNIRRPPQLPKRSALLLLRALCALRVNSFSFFLLATRHSPLTTSFRRKRFFFQRRQNRIRFRGPPSALQPPRRLRQPPPEPPAQKRPRRPNHHHPPPPTHQKVCRHEHPRKHRRYRHRAKSCHLRNRHIPPPHAPRHHFRHVRIDHHNFRADPHARKKSQPNQPRRVRRKRPQKRKHRINQQQQNKRAPPPHSVAPHPKHHRAHKHPQKSRLLQSRPDIRHNKNVVQIKKNSQRHQRNKPPVKPPQRQPLNPLRNRPFSSRHVLSGCHSERSEESAFSWFSAVPLTSPLRLAQSSPTPSDTRLRAHTAPARTPRTRLPKSIFENAPYLPD